MKLNNVNPTIMILRGDRIEDINPPYKNEFVVFKDYYSKLPFPLFDLTLEEMEDEIYKIWGSGYYRVVMFDRIGIRHIDKFKIGVIENE